MKHGIFMYENKFKAFLLKEKIILFNIIISLVAILLRISMLGYRSGDYTGFLHPWLETIKNNGGIAALSKQVGDYNILYQFIITLFSYTPINGLFLYKGLSIIFDFLLAIGVGLTVSYLVPKLKKEYFSFAYAVTLLLPTVSLNSAWWAQCDSIYTTFVVFSIYFLLQDKNKLGFVCLGLAFAFKFQTIFILPFYLLMYFVNNKIHFYHYLLTILTFWLSGLPAFIKGRSLLAPFKIYLNQTNTYKSFFMNLYNFCGVLGFKFLDASNYGMLSKVFMFFTVGILIVGYMGFLISKSKEPVYLLGIAAWTVYTCVMFLPNMHERYAFVVDILLLIIAIVDKRFSIIAVLEILNSLLSYARLLFSANADIIACSYISLLTYALFTFMLFNNCFNGKVKLYRGWGKND